MAATKLRIFQGAARHLADARFALITDDRETQYAMTDAYPGTVEFVMRQAPWRFALTVSELTISTTSPEVHGYSIRYFRPATWLRTHSIYLLAAGGREFPLDCREYGAVIYANSQGVHMRHVSNAFLDPESAATTAAGGWPEHFTQLVEAYLAFSVAERVTGEKGAAARMSQLFASLLPEAVAHDAVPEDPWLQHQLSGSFLRVARAMAEDDMWRFTLTTALIDTASGTPEGGFIRRFPVPSDWMGTRSLYRYSLDTAYTQADQPRPIDVREHAGAWHTNVLAFYAEYVSSTRALDSTLWPDQYQTAVLRKLEFEAANLSGDKEAILIAGAAAEAAMATLRRSEASASDPWLGYQLSGAMHRCIPTVISKGYWKPFLKQRLYNSETDQDAVLTVGDYPYSFSVPADWFKTHAIFIPWDGAECPLDVREREGHWYTATGAFMARYVSTTALDPAAWPDSLAKAVRAYLDLETAPEEAKKNAAELWAEAIATALAEWSAPEDKWLRYQVDGSYWEAVKFVAAAGRWRGAMKTVTLVANATRAADGTISGTEIPTGLGEGAISSSYSAVFTKPGDWYRTIWMYRVGLNGSPVNFGQAAREDIDYRDEGGAWHTNWDTIQVRYLSRDGLVATRVQPSFRNAVLAWLEYEASGHEPKRLQAYQDALQRAEEEDDTRERPPINRMGRFVQSRYGYRGGLGSGSSSSGSGGVVLGGDGDVILTP